MNRKIIIGGSVGVVVLLLSAMFPTVVGNNIDENKIENKTNDQLRIFLEKVIDIKNKLHKDPLEYWFPGFLLAYFIQNIFLPLIILIFSLIALFET